MSPTICHDNDTTLEGEEMCENNERNLNSINNHVINIQKEDESKDPKDGDQSVELQCAKTKLASDELQMKKRRKRKITEVDTVISSLSSSLSDDYGTDTELIAINQNKRRHRNLSRYAPLNIYHDLENDSRNHAFSGSETGFSEQNVMCERNYTISIHEKNITSSKKSIDEIVKKISTTTKISNANTKHLFEVAIATFKLVKKNQEFQVKLRELQMDTKNFISSILENPENQSLSEHLKLLS